MVLQVGAGDPTVGHEIPSEGPENKLNVKVIANAIVLALLLQRINAVV